MTSEKNMSNAPVKPQIPELNLKFNLFCKTPVTKKIIPCKTKSPPNIQAALLIEVK